jgi:ribosomal protein S14
MVSITQTTVKEKKNRFLYKSSEIKRRYYKFMLLQANNVGYTLLKTLPKTRLRNLCLLTGHAHSVYSKKFRLSRHQVKKYFAYITGLRNSSW